MRGVQRNAADGFAVACHLVAECVLKVWQWSFTYSADSGMRSLSEVGRTVCIAHPCRRSKTLIKHATQ